MSETIGERFSTQFSDGEIIANEGPGKGFASYPWVLDDYERALDLSIAESWLLKRLIKHYWKSDSLVYLNKSKICRSSKISRPKLESLFKSLMQKGYIDEVGRRPPGDNRAEYDISGVFLALTFAIKCDPGSNCAQKDELLSIGDFFNNPQEEWLSYTTPKELNRYFHNKGLRYNWCVGHSEPWDIEESERIYEVDCVDCGEQFFAGSATAKYCQACKKVRRESRWNEFVESYKQYAQAENE